LKEGPLLKRYLLIRRKELPLKEDALIFNSSFGIQRSLAPDRRERKGSMEEGGPGE
jgi:hypothetical protein